MGRNLTNQAAGFFLKIFFEMEALPDFCAANCCLRADIEAAVIFPESFLGPDLAAEAAASTLEVATLDDAISAVNGAAADAGTKGLAMGFNGLLKIDSAMVILLLGVEPDVREAGTGSGGVILGNFFLAGVSD